MRITSACHAVHTLRGLYRKEFHANEEWAQLAHLECPAKRTKESAIASGNRVQQGAAKKKDEAYHDVDIFTVALWYHDKVKDNMYDNAHQFANAIKQLLIFLGQSPLQHDTPSVRNEYHGAISGHIAVPERSKISSSTVSSYEHRRSQFLRKLAVDDPKRKWFDVINRNRAENLQE